MARTSTIIHTAASADSHYNGIAIAGVVVNIAGSNPMPPDTTDGTTEEEGDDVLGVETTPPFRLCGAFGFLSLAMIFSGFGVVKLGLRSMGRGKKANLLGVLARLCLSACSAQAGR
ncbi:MAG TPA: hypothetical protein VLM89_06240 [Phycisphaerae bacterium]|nr:hypothetical protein [Phycisphaerae bacterium]